MTFLYPRKCYCSFSILKNVMHSLQAHFSFHIYSEFFYINMQNSPNRWLHKKRIKLWHRDENYSPIETKFPHWYPLIQLFNSITKYHSFFFEGSMQAVISTAKEAQSSHRSTQQACSQSLASSEKHVKTQNYLLYNSIYIFRHSILLAQQ